ncbi:methyltransferase domain-containing protein [Corynebacterium uropygiale]|uniref:Methyltransferase domain-containing protein n=1 Tax=Corynebacterium uropygiale TaxID=1775911 RepID=A0A9X1U6R5_9CORY|nr:class I SAM-dependent methyltransferase [Corynebacterium uropygiale]MCF4005962.1 methyltransferase domain-containing protein [Corynebacterium uropygiale]
MNDTLFTAGENYAAYRPEYPEELMRGILEVAPGRGLAVDVGCGTGQAGRKLVGHVERVLGIDPSLSQLSAAPLSLRVQGIAESLPLREGVADLLIIAQSMHWVQPEPFFREVSRVLAPGGILAVLSYATCSVSDRSVDAFFQDFYWGPFHRFWEPERALVERGLRDIEVPGEPVELPFAAPAVMEKSMDLPAFEGYLGTWSAVRTAEKEGPAARAEFDAFLAELREVWGEPGRRLQVTWPLTVLVRRGL